MTGLLVSRQCWDTARKQLSEIREGVSLSEVMRPHCDRVIGLLSMLGHSKKVTF